MILPNQSMGTLRNAAVVISRSSAYGLQATQDSYKTEALNGQYGGQYGQSSVSARRIIIVVGRGGPCEQRLVPCKVCSTFPDGKLRCFNMLCEVTVCEPPRSILV